MALPKTYSVKEVAKIVDRNPESVRRWIRAGYIDAARIGRSYQISARALDEWFRSRGGGRLIPDEGKELADRLELETPDDLDDVRSVAGRVRQLAGDLQSLADRLDEWGEAVLDSTDKLEAKAADDEEFVDEYTEDMFENEK